MLTVYGEGRGFRVVWLLEELGVAHRLRPIERAYLGRTTTRAAYARAMESCRATIAWAAGSPTL
jgi:hypothetical protein